MSISDSDIAFANELFSNLPDLTTRKMFGGLAIYTEGQIFSLLLSDGKIMLKAKDGGFADRIACQLMSSANAHRFRCNVWPDDPPPRSLCRPQVVPHWSVAPG